MRDEHGAEEVAGRQEAVDAGRAREREEHGKQPGRRECRDAEREPADREPRAGVARHGERVVAERDVDREVRDRLLMEAAALAGHATVDLLTFMGSADPTAVAARLANELADLTGRQLVLLPTGTESETIAALVAAPGLGQVVARARQPLAAVNAQVIQAMATGTGDAVAFAPTSAVDYAHLEVPSVVRRGQRNVTVEALANSGVDRYDIPAFLRHVAPALERQLAASVMAGHTGRCKINLYRSRFEMVWHDGRLTEVTDGYEHKRLDDGDANFPDLTFLQLLFGFRSFEELMTAFVDCYPSDNTTRVLLRALFPKRPSHVIPLG